MLCVKFGWTYPSDLGEDLGKSSMYFQYVAINGWNALYLNKLQTLNLFAQSLIGSRADDDVKSNNEDDNRQRTKFVQKIRLLLN